MMSRAQLLAAVSVGLLGVVFANFSGAQEAPDEGLTLRLDASVLDADDEFGFGACVDGCIDKVEGLVFENLDGFSSPALGEPAGDADAVDLDADAPAVVFDRQTHLATTNFLDATFLTDTSSRDESTV